MRYDKYKLEGVVKNMRKNIFKLLILMVLSIVITNFTGCSMGDKPDDDVVELKADLMNLAKTSTKKYFSKEIDASDFDISFGIKNDSDELISIKNLDDVEEVYFMGHAKWKPEDVVDFLLLYDVKNNIIIKFGIQTLDDDELIFADIKN